VVSIIWIVSAIIKYESVSPDTVHGSYQPAGETKDGLKPWEVDYKKPFYETMVSPSAEKLSVTFFPGEGQYEGDWDEDAKTATVDMPDDTISLCV